MEVSANDFVTENRDKIERCFLTQVKVFGGLVDCCLPTMLIDRNARKYIVRRNDCIEYFAEPGFPG